ncbi:MAG: mono/diheme cytochrome c family protein [Saprospiraceae bacterium]|jgi:mono/diheme cytochrome c family protein
MKSKFFVISATIIGLVFIFSFVLDSTGGDPWPVPEKYEKMKNPVKADSESIALGKSLYSKHCKSCHGKEGLGDGSKAAQLDTPCGDFTAEAFKKQSDGAIYYKTTEGRDDMPGFKKKIPDAEDIWSVVNYIRTLE